MTAQRRWLLVCAALIGVVLGTGVPAPAEAQMAPALSRDAGAPLPPPPALAGETAAPQHPAERPPTAPQKGTLPVPASGARTEGATNATARADRQAPDASGQGGTPWWSTRNAMTMSAAVLLFGLVVIFLATYLIRAGKSAEAVLRIFGTILIIVIAVFLVVAGYSDTQIAPVMGLLGTIAGYLLGKESREKAPPPANGETPQGERPS
jgi:hypothetical protein